ncbi:restriction endonuclease subunit S [Lacticaseibacillus rhamnosus]|uniref:restriction endonuclease subunit S n=1 Tax=Lacticaseibacillus rhamnosus TaxID=47715 RepID=UPI00232E3FC3|nr:restriction endonuclease subunit S [Lacticaseibacillus rhamnosus]MDB7668594.1 restriction endonuclease subunit S [Lacticaseibacillus rhamnosus]
MKDNQAKYPQLRFKGFTYPWEKRYLGDYVVDYTEKTTQENQFPVLTSSQQQGIVLQSEYFSDRQVTTDENIGYFVLPRGYFTYRSRSDNNIFVFNRNDIIDKGIISYFYPVFGLINVDSNFFLRRINNGLNRQLAIAAEGTGQHVLSLKKFKKMETRFPSLPEQKQIGEFLECLDDLITVNQRKLAKLKELKQGYLQKLFPKNGSKFPQLRFSGFADAWEERKLQEVLRERNNQQPQSMEYPLVSFTVENGVTPKTDRYEREQLVVGDKSSKKYKVTVLNDIVYNPANLKFGAISRNKYGNAVFSPIYITFLVNNDVTTPGFIEMFVTRNDFIKRALKYQQGTVYERQSVSPTDLLAMNVYLPGKSEQEKIGSFFQQLDETIALHQRKLEKLQELKKGYLQKMFC